MTKLGSAGFVTLMPATNAEIASDFVGQPGYPAERTAEDISEKCWAFLRSVDSAALSMVYLMVGMATAARIAITAMTTNISTKLKAKTPRTRDLLSE